MPGMPIFQSSPSQLKSLIYVVDSTTTNPVALTVDGAGNLPITGSVDLVAGATVDLAAGATVDLAAGATVDLAAGATVSLTAGTAVDLSPGATVALATGTTVGLTAGTAVDLSPGATVALATGTTVDLAAGATVDLAAGATVDLAAGATVDLAAGAAVGLASGSNIIGKTQNDLVFTNLDSFNVANPPLTSTNIGATATVDAASQDVSKQSSYNWFIKNTGTTPITQDVTLVVQISPDGTNWIPDTGDILAVPANTAGQMITVTNFLKFIRFVITGGASATTVISCFQAQC